jgi:hypothetical protein
MFSKLREIDLSMSMNPDALRTATCIEIGAHEKSVTYLILVKAWECKSCEKFGVSLHEHIV